MPISYTRIETAEAVSGLAEGTCIAEVVDHGHHKRFYPANAPASDGTTAASMIFPHITAVSRVTDHTGAATGPLNLRLAAGLLDPVNVMSPMSFTLDRDAAVVVAEGVF